MYFLEGISSKACQGEMNLAANDTQSLPDRRFLHLVRTRQAIDARNSSKEPGRKNKEGHRRGHGCPPSACLAQWRARMTRPAV